VCDQKKNGKLYSFPKIPVPRMLGTYQKEQVRVCTDLIRMRDEQRICAMNVCLLSRVFSNFVVRFRQSVWRKKKLRECQMRILRHEKCLVPGAMIGFVVFTGSGFLKLFGPILARANKSGLDPDPNLRIRIQRDPKRIRPEKEKNANVKFVDPDPTIRIREKVKDCLKNSYK